ncbi:TIGR03862 family flavoprotein [Neptunicoccus cionae]|uniref:TIGR03862 family flavoprotein n=1 Tax=Neptunicoccus cionae TaxID=2035344 RepID=UPI000C76A776|nr:TIGR03862 family flavoprotein [Amylibacter cionae]PLS22649.1 aminoacetone oxidase family FAD-binding enzyme [Amylibacter cionae]
MTADQTPDALVIGAGPTGLMAAEMLADSGLAVLLAEAKPSVGRKFLMAGKSGLNLTKDEPEAPFLTAFGSMAGPLDTALSEFGPEQVKRWAEDLGQTIFTGSSGRVFPKVMKASPLLRNWLARLDRKGVTLKTRWRWTGWDKQGFQFDTPDGVQTVRPKVTVLALGGASWARLGSDGAWTTLLAEKGAKLSAFAPSNMGITVEWSTHMAPAFGSPLKSIALSSGGKTAVGEAVISRAGLEGSLIYQFSAALRAGAELQIDLFPDRTETQLQERIDKAGAKTSLTNILRKTLRMDQAKAALFLEFARQTPRDTLGSALKALTIPYTGTAPLDQAISVAGGLCWESLSEGFELTCAKGVFCAGEMLDWEAPTGGYLITACLATGRAAGLAAAHAARSQEP